MCFLISSNNFGMTKSLFNGITHLTRLKKRNKNVENPIRLKSQKPEYRCHFPNLAIQHAKQFSSQSYTYMSCIICFPNPLQTGSQLSKVIKKVGPGKTGR
jgi:hypothetical protein